jgi:hypothetical protein
MTKAHEHSPIEKRPDLVRAVIHLRCVCGAVAQQTQREVMLNMLPVWVSPDEQV